MSIVLNLTPSVHPAWIELVLANVDEFIPDHADCERKASAMAMQLVGKYPDKSKIANQLIAVAIEKLQRFQKVYGLMQQRGLELPQDLSHDLYTKQLGWLIKNGKDERFLDKMLIAAFIEAREQQRLQIFYDHLTDTGLKSFYKQFIAANNPYLEMLAEYYPDAVIQHRADALAEEETKIFAALDVKACLR
jgi:tRNA-(ms[2]io[6]A)-hydroxylase